MISITDFTPVELGLPDQFAEFRPAQIDAIEFIANNEKRFCGLALTTGSGKSLIGLGAARATGYRAVILTATRGLQTQYMNMGQVGLVDIRGRSNYDCARQPTSCRFGELEGCPLALSSYCNYEGHRLTARSQPLVVTNYAYWLRINEYGRGLESDINPIELLILDEAHAAVEQLSKHLAVSLRETWLRAAGYGPADYPADEIGDWARFAYDSEDNIADRLKSAIVHLRRTKSGRDKVWELSELSEAMAKIRAMGANQDQWVCELRLGTKYGRMWDFDCVWPALYSHKLFQSVPHVALMSATLRATTMSMLGIKATESEFREWPRVFPAELTPVYYVPTVKMNRKVTDEGLRWWVERIDEIIESRLDRKGIIHTVSFDRQRYLLEHSRYSRLMRANISDSETASAAQIVDAFRADEPPSILVSPSFSTGWDFPGRQCEYQIIAKVPYPNHTSKVMAARNARRRNYTATIAMQDLIQAIGRATRAHDDRCEIFIIDNGIVFFLISNASLKPRWFDYQKVLNIPQPPPRIK